VGQALLPVGGNLAALLRACVDIGLEGERHDVGGKSVDDGASLGAGAAVRLLDGDRVAGLRLPVGGEYFVVGFVEFAGGVVGDVEKGRIGSLRDGGDGQAGNKGSDDEASVSRADHLPFSLG